MSEEEADWFSGLCPVCKHPRDEHYLEGCDHDWTYIDGIAVENKGCHCRITGWVIL